MNHTGIDCKQFDHASADDGPCLFNRGVIKGCVEIGYRQRTTFCAPDDYAAQIVIGDGARVEGNLTALEVAIHGAFKGTVHGNTVRLKGAATVEGEIFSKSLAVEENVQFEGVSRKLEKPIDSSAIARTPTVKPVAGATTTGPAAAAAA